ncbi:MAG: MarR family winged helix-turn-helix transcriptional regulator [Acidaminococcaceae bacterium]|nr:MarR family winged helix-turn-helix transcriptional regulator [Acidaminococcaceae bacterium]MDD4722834.1 MarR family winged helix-turn-helix transcriptional regulator [Acidaminococcaceae bacterium]
MKKTKAISTISKIKEHANSFIMQSLAQHGVHGLVSSHGDILVVLFHGQKVTMKDVADTIHRTKPTVTVLIAKLVDLGLVKKERSAEDARVSYVELTDKGRDFKEVFEAISLSVTKKLFQGFSEIEQKKFEEYLNRVYTNIR